MSKTETSSMWDKMFATFPFVSLVIYAFGVYLKGLPVLLAGGFLMGVLSGCVGKKTFTLITFAVVALATAALVLFKGVQPIYFFAAFVMAGFGWILTQQSESRI